MPARPLGRRWRSLVYVVADESLRPHLAPGDRILVDPRAYDRELPEVGDVVVVRDPELSDRRLVKRVDRVTSTGPAREDVTLTILGAPGTESRDSRRFGPVPLGSVIGKAWYRDRPRERAGPIERIP